MFERRNRKKREPSAMRENRSKGCSSLHLASEGRWGRAFTWKRPRLYGFPREGEVRLLRHLERDFRQAYGRRFFYVLCFFLDNAWSECNVKGTIGFSIKFCFFWCMATLVWTTFLCNFENLDLYARPRRRGPRLPSAVASLTYEHNFAYNFVVCGPISKISSSTESWGPTLPNYLLETVSYY